MTDPRADWLQELEQPTEGFFLVFARRVKAEDGVRAACREAIAFLAPRINWAAYLPHMPHGLLGLWAVLRLEALLERPRFLRMLAAQLHLFAHEGRQKGEGFLSLATGSGSREHLRLALERHQPAWAWGEAMALEVVPEDFRALALQVAPDMACVGHKAVLAHRLGELARRLEAPGLDRLLLALAAWLGASEPSDLFWQKRILKRLGDPAPRLASGRVGQPEELARLICQEGLVGLLDGLAAGIRAGATREDLLLALASAAASKQRDAGRELEGKTSWSFVFLASMAALDLDAAAWCRAAALVNLFPSLEPGRCVQPREPRRETSLREAILDGEVAEALFLARACFEAQGAEALLRMLCEAAAEDDPHGNHAHPVLALAACVELLPELPRGLQGEVLVSLAKSLAHARGSCDLSNRASSALAAEC